MLSENHVKYLLVGGYAVGYHGYPRATVDMDIWIEQTPENAEKTIAALRKFGFDTPDLSIEVLLEKDRMLRMGVPPLRLEIITSVSGVEFGSCYENRISETIDGLKIDIINLADLKANKKASGRNKDLADLENLP